MDALLYHFCALGDLNQVMALLGSSRKRCQQQRLQQQIAHPTMNISISVRKADNGRHLCKHNFDLSKRQGPNETTVFHLACATGNVRTLLVLLDELFHQRLSPEKALLVLEQRECSKVGGYTALHHACDAGNAEVVQLLLERGVNPDTKDMNCGFTALHIAVRRKHLNVVRELVCRGGADINARDEYGNNPAYWFKELRGENEQIAQLLGPPRCATIEERFHAIYNHRVKHKFPISTLKPASTSDIASHKSKLKSRTGGKKKKTGAKKKNKK